MHVCLMIEGQEGVAWSEWSALGRAAESAGLHGLFRSDHYTSFHGGPGAALDAWATINALAATTDRIRLGTLVSAATFRHPSELARVAVTADHVSGGPHRRRSWRRMVRGRAPAERLSFPRRSGSI